MAKAWSVKFKSFNRIDYVETVSAKDEAEARKLARKARHDDRDKVEWVKENTTVDKWFK